MRVSFRVDASQTIGSGHVMRCRSLARELRRQNDEVQFICKNLPGNLIEYLREDSFKVAILEESDTYLRENSSLEYRPAVLSISEKSDASHSIDIVREFKPDWLVVDHYSLGVVWENYLRKTGVKICVIDDLARKHNCDLLIDQNYYGNYPEERYIGKLQNNCSIFLGPRYALIDKNYTHIRRNLNKRDGHVSKILVFFGGVDKKKFTMQAIKALNHYTLSDIDVDIVIGNANLHRDEIFEYAKKFPRYKVYENLPDLAALMHKNDLMLGAGGSTTWERCCLGLPAIVVAVSKNQQQFSELLFNTEIQFRVFDDSENNLDSLNELDWISSIQCIRKAPERMKLCSIRSMKLVDGLGVNRVTAHFKISKTNLKVRPAVNADELLLFDWANDPLVRKNAFSKSPIDYESHRTWFLKILSDQNVLILIGEDEFDLPIGQIRFNCDRDEAKIDISLDSAFLGQGLGKQLLKLGLSKLRQKMFVKKVIAEVFPYNTASSKLFLSMGFKQFYNNDGDYLIFSLSL